MRLLRFTAKWFPPDVRLILALFVAWRIWITVFALFAIEFVPLRSIHFLGGGFSNYITNPLLLAWANFDGEHYLAIASHGYEKLNHSFFPIYPLLMMILTTPFSMNLSSLVLSGLFISDTFFLLSLFVLWELIHLDYSRVVARTTIFLLLLFPTSFYFASLYTESLFLFLVLGSFYSARRGKWWLAGLLGAISSGVRIVGVLLLPALLWEYYRQSETQNAGKTQSLLWIFLIPAGLVGYMIFLWQTTGDPLSFYRELATFGVQREGSFVLLPQVFYRYINMLFVLGKTDPFYLTLVMEMAIAILSVVLLVFGYVRKFRLSYLIFAGLAYLLPTFTGSFSSLPRYFLVIFPFFILLGLFFSSRSVIVRFLVYSLLFCLLFVETALFVMGYWVA